MWIAKPLRSLSSQELSAWREILVRQKTLGKEPPLAQSIAWGHAIEAVSGQVHVVFSPEESVGGIVFATRSGEAVQFECTNGPLLDWDDESAAKRQLAVFATAVSRLDSRFARLVLRPRWLKGVAPRKLPIAPAAVSFAATLKIPLSHGQNPENTFTPRLRRTLRNSDRARITAQWEELTSSRLVEFALAAQAFGRARGFTVPPIFWFKALTDSSDSSLRFGLVSARSPNGDMGCQLLIAYFEDEAHYLFGHEWRLPGARATLSPSAIAHRFAIHHAREAQMKSYDFNGTLESADPTHTYAGVARFKAQFGGQMVRYEVSELKIEI